MIRIYLHLPLLAGLSLFAAQAAGQTTYQISVQQSGVARDANYPLMPDDHRLFMGASEWHPAVVEDPAIPFRGLHGVCFGMTELKADLVVGGGGFCTYEDADGDRYTSSWVPKDSARGAGSSGEWTAIGGTGKFEGVTGGGVYRIGRIAGDLRTRQLSGVLTLLDCPPSRFGACAETDAIPVAAQ